MYLVDSEGFYFGIMLKIWKYALGSFSDDKTAPYDNHILLIRSLIFISILTTNLFIVAGVIRHWDDQKQVDTCSSPVVK